MDDEHSENEILKTNEIDDEILKDINLGAATIKKRADGLLDFVKDYRTIPNVPVPKIKQVNVKDFYKA